jgi:N12 class adenine-specific DNA methylase
MGGGTLLRTSSEPARPTRWCRGDGDGTIRKPMFVVPNHLVDQFAGDFVRLYPGANVFAAGEGHFEKKNRKKAMARIAATNYDAVIVGHSSFKLLPVTNETFMSYMSEQLAEIDAVIEPSSGLNQTA